MFRLFAAALLGFWMTAPAWAADAQEPDASLAAVQGAWQGTLTYKDYSRPDRQVSLPTTLHVALGAPDELVLHYRFADGPGKTVYSYERMRFDTAGQRVLWLSGSGAERTERSAAIVTDRVQDGQRQIVFERAQDAQTYRYTLELGAKALSLQKEELAAGQAPVLRNRYQFQRLP